MRFTYDPRYNIAYLRFKEKPVEVEAIRISDELVVDIAPDGTVYGIELLNANEQLQREDTGELVIVNEATGERVHYRWLSTGLSEWRKRGASGSHEDRRTTNGQGKDEHSSD